MLIQGLLFIRAPDDAHLDVAIACANELHKITGDAVV